MPAATCTAPPIGVISEGLFKIGLGGVDAITRSGVVTGFGSHSASKPPSCRRGEAVVDALPVSRARPKAPITDDRRNENESVEGAAHHMGASGQHLQDLELPGGMGPPRAKSLWTQSAGRADESINPTSTRTT